MPGGRLTLEDRQTIAAGLVHSRGYAEIARRLGRPTSTIAREVARNGGPGGYRADHAHLATRSRARRSVTTAADAPPAASDHGRDLAAIRGVMEEFTEVIVATGLSRMTARVLSSLYLADNGSLTAAELVRQLQVSPASISKAVGELEAQELIRRQRDPGHRRDRYVIDDEAWYRAWLASARQNAVLADTARRGAEILGTATSAGMRLQDMSEFLDRVVNAMVDAAEHSWQVLSARRMADHVG